MKVLRAVNTLEELERLLEDVGSLLPLSVAAISLGVHGSRIYQLAEAGRLRIFAVFGAYQTPLADVKDRIAAKAAGRLKASRPVLVPKARPRKARDARLVGEGFQTVESEP